jgi:hypothetical protein
LTEVNVKLCLITLAIHNCLFASWQRSLARFFELLCKLFIFKN